MSDLSRFSVLKRFLRGVARLSLTLAILGASGGAVAGIAAALAQRAASAPLPDVPAPVPVRTIMATPEAGFTVTRRFLGQITAVQSAVMGFELGGRVTEVAVRAGDRVTKGTVLARIDTAALAADRAAVVAERAALAAQADLAARTTDRQMALEARGFAPTQASDNARFGLAELQARIAATEAHIGGIDVALAKSVLIAPFDAEIGTRHLDPGATVGVGTPVLTLMSLATPEVRVGLPPALAATLDQGDTARIDIDGMSMAAHLLRLRPDVSAATRTREATFALDPPPGAPRSAYGQSAQVLITEEISEPGYRVPVSALSDGPRGSWQVMLALPDGQGFTVRPEAVEILHTDGQSVFLRAAFPEGVRLIAAGTHRVTAGQPVAPLVE